jgi:hypothetical protein
MSISEFNVTARILFRQAQKLQSNSQFKEAAEVYGKCLEIEPRFYGAAYAQASCYGSIGVDDLQIVQAY